MRELQELFLTSEPKARDLTRAFAEGALTFSLREAHRSAWSAQRATETVAAKHASFADERGTGTVTASEYDKNQQ